MKCKTLQAVSVFVMLVTCAWAQPQQQPSNPGETLRHSQDTMEYYKLQRKLDKGQKHVNAKDNKAKDNTGNQKAVEIINGENGVIQFFDEDDPDQQN